MKYKCHQKNCNGNLIQSKYVLLSHPLQYQYRCEECGHKYIRTDGMDNLHSHFDQQYGGD
jgi:hypothetical protein